MNNQKKTPWEYESIYVGRQPVFDCSMNLRGYELFYRSEDSTSSALFQDSEEATQEVIQSSYVAPFMDMQKSSFLMINFSFQGIRNRAPFALPPARTIIKLSGHLEKNPERIRILTELKDEGYQVAFDSGIMDCGKWGELADICIVDALDPQIDKIMARAEKINQAGLKLMAKRVETRECHEVLKQAGFSMFQGFFFQKPETVKGTNLSAHQVMRLKILQLLQTPDPDLDKLADILEKEVSLAYRILRYVNSAHFSIPVKIRSIRHALSYIGFNHLKMLLELFLIRSITPTAKPSELPFTSALRGRFLETLAREHAAFKNQADSLFMLGLLSLLDAIFDMPMEKVLQGLPLEKDLHNALCRLDSPYLPWLDLTLAFEDASWEKVDQLVDSLGLNPVLVARNYAQSQAWTREFFDFQI